MRITYNSYGIDGQTAVFQDEKKHLHLLKDAVEMLLTLTQTVPGTDPNMAYLCAEHVHELEKSVRFKESFLDKLAGDMREAVVEEADILRELEKTIDG